MKSEIRRAAVHPFVFAVYPILFLYSVNLGQMRFFDAAVPASVSLLVVVAIWLFLRRLLKDAEKSALMVSSCCFSFYAYGAFAGIFASAEIRDVWLPIGWLAAWVVNMAVIYRSSSSESEPATRFLNVVALVLILFLCSNILSFHLSGPGKPVVSTAEPSRSALIRPDSDLLPDIYYLILDGYARNDVLKEVYNYDNSDFTDFLKQQGFFVAERARANYAQTYLSLASSMNFSYLDHLTGQYKDVNSVQPLVEMIAGNKFFELLKENGYTTVAFSSGYSGTELRNADVYLSRSLMSREFLNMLINSTVLVAMKFPFLDMSVSQADIHRERITDTIATIATMRFSRPAAVFAHILCPHPPFVFGAAGEKIAVEDRFHYNDGSHWGSDSDKYRRQYKDQLIHINSLMKASLSRLLKDTGRRKIIVLQSDHGPGSSLNWQKPEESDLRERMAILYAVYKTDQDYRDFYDDVSPVNTFRLIFRGLFQTKTAPLPDKSFFSPWWGRYRFNEITGLL